MSRHSANPFRRTAVVATIAAVSTVVAMVVPGLASAQEQDDFVSGSGRAKSAIVRVGPSAARLSLAPTVGVALADHIGTLGRGETLIFDYATLDTSVNNNFPELKQEFPSLRVESRDEGSEAGVRWEPKPGIIEDAAATDAPVGRSAITLDEFDLPGIIEVSGAKARSFSGVYKRTVDDQEELIRAAGGTVDIGRVELLGGAIVLSDLRWEGAQITDRNEDDEVEQRGNFYVGKVVAQGETVFSELSADKAEDAFAGINAGLEPLGLTLIAPTIRTQAGVVTVSPLGVRIASDTFKPLVDGLGELRRIPVPSDEEGEDDIPLSERFIRECQAGESGEESDGEGGGASTGGLLGRVDPGATVFANHGDQHEEFDELNNDGPSGNQEDPEPEFPGAAEGGSNCGLPFLALDLALAPFGGGGQFEIELGGVLGTTEGDVVEQFDLFGTDFEGFEDIDTEFDASGDSGGATPPSVAGTNVSAPDPTTPPTTEQSVQAPQGGEQQAAGPQDIRLTGSRASAAWAVGLVGLGMALAMALSDYRRLRARRRAITPIS